MKIIDLLKHSSEKYATRIALHDEVCTTTYSQILSNVSILSDHLKSVGCGPGIKVAIALPNSALYFAAFFAISHAGATIVPFSFKMTIYEMIKLIKRADISVMLTDETLGNALSQRLEKTDGITVMVLKQRAAADIEAETIAIGKIKHDIKNQDVALMLFTSGTTGLSKIAMLTDDQLIFNMFAYRSVMGFKEGNDTVYCSLPLHHTYSICAQILTHISLGDSFIVTSKPFFIKDFLSAVEFHKITITAFVPYMAILLAEYPDSDKFEISSLRYITLSSAKKSKLVYQKLVNKFKNIKFVDLYGMSEAGSRISTTFSVSEKLQAESVGMPLPGVQIRIMDDNGNILPENSVGEIEVKSKSIFKGYFDQPSLTQQTVIDGWLKTGDIGRIDEQGNLFLVGRKKEIIICGGENIFPAEIEDCLLEHPWVLDAAVVSAPHPKLQETPVAFVVIRGDHQVDAAELIRFCQNRLSSFKVPARINFIKEMPRLGTPKVDKQKLREIAKAQM